MSASGTWDDPNLSNWWVEGFTDGADPEYTEQIIPLVVERLAWARTVLDVGTGEGQLARALADVGVSTVGIDLFPRQIATAVERGGGPAYGLATATAIPLADRSIDAAVACLVFEHIDDVDAAINEIARVLRPGGIFLFLLNHPLLQTPDSGWVDDRVLDPPDQYWRIGNYLSEAVTVEEVGKGVFVKFVHRPLHRYLNAVADAGMRLDWMDEPAPPPGFLQIAPHYEAAAYVPRLLVLQFHKTRTPGIPDTLCP